MFCEKIAKLSNNNQSKLLIEIFTISMLVFVTLKCSSSLQHSHEVPYIAQTKLFSYLTRMSHLQNLMLLFRIVVSYSMHQ